jgi:exosome complex protein LRP1
VDPSKHALKSEIDRVREYFARAKQVHDRKTIMPRINTAAAQRFIRSGLWQPNCNDNGNTDVRVQGPQSVVKDVEIIVEEQ